MHAQNSAAPTEAAYHEPRAVRCTYGPGLLRSAGDVLVRSVGDPRWCLVLRCNPPCKQQQQPQHTHGSPVALVDGAP